MTAFLKKPITLRINLIWTAVILLLILGIALCLYLRVPDNLYFMLMEPDWVSSAQVSLRGTVRDLTPQELRDVVSILNDFRFEDVGERCFGPDPYEYADIRLHMKSGKTLTICCSGGFYGVGEYSYPNSQALWKLGELWKGYRKAYLQEPVGGVAG